MRAHSYNNSKEFDWFHHQFPHSPLTVSSFNGICIPVSGVAELLRIMRTTYIPERDAAYPRSKFHNPKTESLKTHLPPQINQLEVLTKKWHFEAPLQFKVILVEKSSMVTEK